MFGGGNFSLVNAMVRQMATFPEDLTPKRHGDLTPFMLRFFGASLLETSP